MAELPQGEVIYIIILGSLGMLTLIVGFAVFIMIYQKNWLHKHRLNRAIHPNY